jgi:nucleoside-diphosphate-sugar epimerase
MDKINTRLALVTGGVDFIGSHLVNGLYIVEIAPFDGDTIGRKLECIIYGQTRFLSVPL